MKTDAVFGENDTGLTAIMMNITVKTMSGVDVDTTGWTMAESQRGSYNIEVPLCVERSSIYLNKITDPTVFYDGFLDYHSWDVPLDDHLVAGSTGKYLQGAGMAGDPWLSELPDGYVAPQAGYVLVQLQEVFDKFTLTIGQLLTQTYNAGQVTSPYSPLPAHTLTIYARTNYLGTATVGDKWGTILSTAGVKVFFTVKSTLNQTTPTIDVECTILDPVLGIVQVALSKTQSDIRLGDYFWQLEARTYMVVGTPPNQTTVVDEIWMMQEGKLYVKQTFKSTL